MDSYSTVNNFGRLVICLAFLVGFAFCYDFSDPTFNSYLQSELEDLAEEASTARVQRDAEQRDAQNQEVADEYFKCKHKNLKSCCGKINIMKNYGEKSKTYGKECYEQVVNEFKSHLNSTQSDDEEGMMDMFTCEKIKMMKMKHICINECIGKKTQILSENGSLIPNAIKDYARENMFNEEWSKELGERALSKCLVQTYNNAAKVEEFDIKCDPTYVQFQYCLWREVEMNCPESKKDTKPKCTKLRDRLKKQTSGM